MNPTEALRIDFELVEKIKYDADQLGIIYKKCKPNSIKFLQKYSGGTFNIYELEDIFQDSIIVFYEKILQENFKLSCTIQTYINSVCRNIFLNKVSKSKKVISWNEHLENNSFYDPEITDIFKEVETINDQLFKALELALKDIKESGGKCYELLSLYWYHKKSMKEISDLMGYTNADNTKNQKAKCQKRLKNKAFMVLKTF